MELTDLEQSGHLRGYHLQSLRYSSTQLCYQGAPFNGDHHLRCITNMLYTELGQIKSMN